MLLEILEVCHAVKLEVLGDTHQFVFVLLVFLLIFVIGIESEDCLEC
jgi:hypothetical protein